MKKEKKPKKILKGCLTAIAIALFIILAIGIVGAMGESKKNDKEDATKNVEETDTNGWTEDDKLNFMTIAQSISDKFIDDYKHPWNLKEWTFAKFDDKNKIVATTDYTLKETSVKQPMMCVFTWNEKDESYLMHFFSVGDAIFFDDGECDEFFETLSEMTESKTE